MKLESFNACIQSCVPCHVMGDPGIGKTRMAESFEESLGIPVEIIIGSQRGENEIAGLPTLEDDTYNGNPIKRSVYAPPDWAWVMANADKNEKCKSFVRGIVGFDELTTVSASKQANMLQIINDKKVSYLKFNRIAFFALSNPPAIAADGHDLTAPMGNRFVHFQHDVRKDEWVEGMLNGFKPHKLPILSPDWEKHIPAYRAKIAGFINAKPQLLKIIPKEESKRGEAWPSPRTWDMASRLLCAVDLLGYGEDISMECIVGTVGIGAGREYITWEREADLPDIEELLKDPDKYVVPTRQDITFTILGGIAVSIQQNITKERWKNGWDIILRTCKGGKKDIAACAAKTMLETGSAKGYSAPNLSTFDSLMAALGYNVNI